MDTIRIIGNYFAYSRKQRVEMYIIHIIYS